jgi:hypothetical protein
VNPIPFLITQIIASNIGGTATLIGDPPNIMIGSAIKELSFMAFINNLAPIAAIILAAQLPIFVWLFRKGIRTTDELKQSIMTLDEKELISDPVLLRKCLVILSVTLLGFFTHQLFHLESATVALAGAFLLLLLTGEHMMEAALAKVEWMTIFFFVGLFVLVSGLIETGVIARLAEKSIELTGGHRSGAAVVELGARFMPWRQRIAYRCKCQLDRRRYGRQRRSSAPFRTVSQVRISINADVHSDIKYLYISALLGIILRRGGTSMLTYCFDENVIRISETANNDDTEFRIRIIQERPYLEAMKEVQKEFEHNRVYTDVLFYLYPNHEFHAIVRKDYYAEFVLELMKHRLLQKVEWILAP